jgi:hypothetical protein
MVKVTAASKTLKDTKKATRQTLKTNEPKKQLKKQVKKQDKKTKVVKAKPVKAKAVKAKVVKDKVTKPKTVTKAKVAKPKVAKLKVVKDKTIKAGAKDVKDVKDVKDGDLKETKKVRHFKLYNPDKSILPGKKERFGRYKGDPLKAAHRAFSSVVKLYKSNAAKYAEAGKILPKKLEFGIVECTKRTKNKNKMHCYIGERIKLDKMKIVPITRKKKKEGDVVDKDAKPVKDICTSFTDEEGNKKFLVFSDHSDYDAYYAKISDKTDEDVKGEEKVTCAFGTLYDMGEGEYLSKTKDGEKVSPKGNLYKVKFLKITDESSPVEDRAKNLIIHRYQHSVKKKAKPDGIKMLEPKPKKKKVVKPKVEKVVGDTKAKKVVKKAAKKPKAATKKKVVATKKKAKKVVEEQEQEKVPPVEESDSESEAEVSDSDEE